MPFYNRSSSAIQSGGITSRTGSGTEEIFRKESTPTAQSTSSSGGGSGFWSGIKNFFSNHSKGAGKTIGAGLSIGAKVADKFTGGLATPIVDIAKEGLATIGDNFKGSGFQKFTKGLANKKISDTIDKAANAFNNNKLGKIGKWKELGSLVKDYRVESKKSKPIPTNPVANTSNGHVPAGYQATSAQGATIPVKSTSKNKKKGKNKKASKQWSEWLNKKIKNKNKGRKKK